jgi:hypothetical protein
MKKTFKYKVPLKVSKTIEISEKDIMFICCRENIDDDSCANTIHQNYGLDMKEAWKVVDLLWKKFGREF